MIPIRFDYQFWQMMTKASLIALFVALPSFAFICTRTEAQQPTATTSLPHVQYNLDPGQPDLAHLISRGSELSGQGHYAEAEALFKEFICIHPNDPTGFFWLGKVADETGRSQDAFHDYVESLSRAKAIGMDSEELRLNLGNTLLKLGYFKEATYDFQRAIDINSKNADAHFNLAKLFLVTGQDTKALAELDSCANLGLNNSHVTLFRAWAHKRLGQLEESKREASRFLEQASQSEPKELQDFARTQF
jgi:tetratricopeptide (TPR) repeat protein